jgi:hypothetical protein
MRNVVFWDMKPCGTCKNRRFGGMYRLHRQDEKNLRARITVSNKEWCLLGCYAVWLLLERWFLQESHGVTSQKITVFIVTTVKTSNLTYR